MPLNPPSTKNVNDYFKNQYEKNASGYRPLNDFLTTIVARYPSHTDWEHVMIKAALINNLYRTNIFDIRPMVEHIILLEVESKINVGEEKAVDEVRKFRLSEDKSFDRYSFATKYCHFHNKSSYPIFDENVKLALLGYKNESSFSQFTEKDLRDYSKFKDVLGDFLEWYGLVGVPLDVIDKFLWNEGRVIKNVKKTSNK